MSENLPQPIVDALDEAAPVALDVIAATPSYRMDPLTSVAVSSRNGVLWEGRIKAGDVARKAHLDAADECIRYYNNNQLGVRDGNGPERAGNRYFAKRRGGTVFSETENVVYSNTRAKMPALYAKNPQVEFTTKRVERKGFVRVLEQLVNHIANIPDAPGLNLAVHARQATLAAELTNLAWIEFGYNERGDSSYGVQDELIKLSEELATAADDKTIREVEGKIMALEEQLDLFTAPGPFVRYRMLRDVVTDPEASMPDFSDGKWAAFREFYPTAYLNAKYTEVGEDGIRRSIYMPTDVVMATDGDTSDLSTFKLFNRDESAQSYGYNSDKELRKAHRTMCWRIYDKVTRRVYLYADNKWDWPIWAENDPYGLPSFIPAAPLYFNNTPVGPYARSNVTYYLDQQDALNEIHSEFRMGRQSVRDAMLVDSDIGRDVTEKFLRGSQDADIALPVKVPEGKKLAELVFVKPNAMANAMPLFDPGRVMASIDRLSGVTELLRGAQLKTNTTKFAAEQYSSTTGQRLDENIDAIETCIGKVLYGVAFLCARFMRSEEVGDMLGQEAAQEWNNFDPSELRTMFLCQAVGGSTQKPTAAVKKDLAMEIARVLQPFGQYAPSVVMDIVLTTFDEAFDNVNLPPDAFKRVKDEVLQRLQQQMGAQQPQGGAPPQEQQGQSLEEVAQAVDALPPEAKQALGAALAKGVPVMEAIPQVLAMMQQTGAMQ